MSGQLHLSPDILPSIIESVGMVVAALITILGLLITSKRVLSRERLKTKLEEAYNDLRTMQEVERVHVEIEIGRGNPSNQNKVRRIVAEEKGLRTSGNNSPAQLERRIADLSNY